jgi:hypothetical protein
MKWGKPLCIYLITQLKSGGAIKNEDPKHRGLRQLNHNHMVFYLIKKEDPKHRGLRQ